MGELPEAFRAVLQARRKGGPGVLKLPNKRMKNSS